MNSFETPLKANEFVELGELLASIPEPFEPMEPDYLDGFLTALLCLPEEPSPSEWMPFIFDSQARAEARITNDEDQDRLEELIYRRYRSIDLTLAKCRPIDPIIYEIEDNRGHPITKGASSVAAVIPFALGFSEVINRWEGLKDSDTYQINGALLGILRHLPDDVIGDLKDIKEELDMESPIEDLDQALEDLAESVAEIVETTRGFVKKSPSTPAKKKGPFNGKKKSHYR